MNSEETPIQPPEKSADSFVQKPIRTFESDMAEALAKQKGSVASIAIAESKRRDEKNKQENATKLSKKELAKQEAEEAKKQEEQQKAREVEEAQKQRLAAIEKQKDDERQKELERQQMEMARAREIEKQREITEAKEIEGKGYMERGEQRAQDREMELQRQREAEAQKQKEAETERQRKQQAEMEARRAQEMARQAEMEKQQQKLMAEKAAEMEKQRQMEAAKAAEQQKALEIQRKEDEIRKNLERQKELEKQKEMERQRALEKQKAPLLPQLKKPIKVVKIENTSTEVSGPRASYLKPILMIILSLLFIGGGIYGGYYLYSNSALGTPATISTPITVSSLIPADTQLAVDVSGLEGDKLIQQIHAQFDKNAVAEGKILELVLQESHESLDKSGKKPIITTERVTASSFIKKTGINIPDVLVRSLTDRWMIGQYTEETGQKTPFIALTTDFFQNAFAGMLTWESTMSEDLADLLGYKTQNPNNQNSVINNGTSTSILTTSAFSADRGQFVDRQIRNRDVREFRNNKGQLVFLYSFINKETFVLTTSESAFIAGIDRIEKQSYVR